jgi:hypothetical protein
LSLIRRQKWHCSMHSKRAAHHGIAGTARYETTPTLASGEINQYNIVHNLSVLSAVEWLNKICW